MNTKEAKTQRLAEKIPNQFPQRVVTSVNKKGPPSMHFVKGDMRSAQPVLNRNPSNYDSIYKHAFVDPPGGGPHALIASFHDLNGVIARNQNSEFEVPVEVSDNQQPTDGPTMDTQQHVHEIAARPVHQVHMKRPETFGVKVRLRILRATVQSRE